MKELQSPQPRVQMVDVGATLARASLLMSASGASYLGVTHSGAWVGVLLDSDLKQAILERPRALIVRNYMRSFWQILGEMISELESCPQLLQKKELGILVQIIADLKRMQANHLFSIDFLGTGLEIKGPLVDT